MKLTVRAACILLAAGSCSAADRKDFISSEYLLRFSVPASWDRPIDEGPDRGIAGPDGYVKLTALGGPKTIADACRVESEHRMQPNGPNPRVEKLGLDGQPGCRIVPTLADAQERKIPAGLILQYHQPLQLEPRRVHTRPYPYLVVWTDPNHLAMIEETLRLDP